MLQMYIRVLGLTTAVMVGGNLPRKQALKLSDATIEMGQFKVGQIKESTLSITNTASEDVVIDRVMSTCGCLHPEIESDIIPMGHSASLRIIASRQFPGKFTYSIVVIPKEVGKYGPLKINVDGEARLSVSPQVGWRAGILQQPSFTGVCDLGTKHRASADLIVRVTPVETLEDMRGFVVDANSSHFRLDGVTDSSGERLGRERDNIANASRLTLAFKPKKPLTTGRLRDSLEISFRDGSKLYMPIACRIVGDAYVQQEIIHLGKLGSCSTQNLDILFADGVERWSNVQWNGTGLLRQSLDIRQIDSNQSHEVKIALSVDSTRLLALPKGYLFCRVRLYQHQPTDRDAVSILVDGFNSERPSPLQAPN